MWLFPFITAAEAGAHFVATAARLHSLLLAKGATHEFEEALAKTAS